MNRFVELLDRVTIRYQLNPSGWIPRFRAPEEGVYQAAYPIVGDGSKVELDESQPSYHHFFSGYELMWSWVYHLRQQDGKDPLKGFWQEFWFTLHEISLGVYDTTNWKEVDPEERQALD